MRLSTRLHGTFDYIIGIVLVAAPWVLGFADVQPAMAAAAFVGAALILSALVTNFELGLVRRVHIPLHLWVDGILGLLLAISPWLVGFDGEVWAPHLVAGLVIIAVAFFSDTIPGYDRRGSRTGPRP